MDLLTKAAEAKKHFEGYLASAEYAFADRQQWREESGIKVVAFCGHGRHGKDTCGEIWQELTAAEYRGSVSKAVLPLVAWAMGVPKEECWETRHENRDFWKNFCDALRIDDPTFLLRLLLARADIICGIRARAEFWSAWGEGLIGYAAWVLRPGVPDDPTYDFANYEDWRYVPVGTSVKRGKFLVFNNGSLDELRVTLRDQARKLGLLQERSL